MVRVVRSPIEGQQLKVRPGEAVELRLRRSACGSRWRLAVKPDHLLDLTEDGLYGVRFLVFRAPQEAETPHLLRLELTPPGAKRPTAVRHLGVVTA
jgi:hypothetical protein